MFYISKTSALMIFGADKTKATLVAYRSQRAWLMQQYSHTLGGIVAATITGQTSALHERMESISVEICNLDEKIREIEQTQDYL
jgi:hypothetical protein